MMYSELQQSKAHVASLQAEVNLKDEALQSLKVLLHPSFCARMTRIKHFCAIFKKKTSCCFQRML
jgi:hypothetical protein